MAFSIKSIIRKLLSVCGTVLEMPGVQASINK